MGAGLGRRAPVPPTPLQDIPCEGEASEDTVAALLLQTQVPRLLRGIRQSVQAGLAPAWQAGQLTACLPGVLGSFFQGQKLCRLRSWDKAQLGRKDSLEEVSVGQE